jgi:hypothetical protein
MKQKLPWLPLGDLGALAAKERVRAPGTYWDLKIDRIFLRKEPGAIRAPR